MQIRHPRFESGCRLHLLRGQHGKYWMDGSECRLLVAIDAARHAEGRTKLSAYSRCWLSWRGDARAPEGLGSRDLLFVTSSEDAPGGPITLSDQLLGKFAAAHKEHPDMASRIDFWQLDAMCIHGTRMLGKVEGIETRLVAWFAERFEREAASSRKPGAETRPAHR